MDERYARMVGLSQQYPCWGDRKIYDLMNAEKLPISCDRVRLIRRREGLQVVKKAGNTSFWALRRCGYVGRNMKGGETTFSEPTVPFIHETLASHP